jgi:ribonuclease PH
MTGFGERQVRLDCDVLQADGGTRTASITGGYVALYLAFEYLARHNLIEKIPLSRQVAAISCGLYEGAAVADLDYAEDSKAQTDANFVLTSGGGIVEIQATAEQEPFLPAQFDALMALATVATEGLFALQNQAIEAAVAARDGAAA